MTGELTALLASLPTWAFAGVLLISRLGAASMVMPVTGEAELPATIRLGFVLALVALLLPVVAPAMPPMPESPWLLCFMITSEIATGLWFGWLVRLWALALPLAGQVIAGTIGIANVLQPDPTLGPQTSALARGLGLAAPVVLLATGGLRLMLGSLADTYRIVSAGHVLPPGDTLQSVIAAVSGSFALSLQLAAPFVLASVVWQIALGLLARLVPQLQVYFAAAPGLILGGLALLGLVGGRLLETWSERMHDVLVSFPAS